MEKGFRIKEKGNYKLGDEMLRIFLEMHERKKYDPTFKAYTATIEHFMENEKTSDFPITESQKRSYLELLLRETLENN